MSQLEFPFQPDRAEVPSAQFLTIAEAAVRVRCCERTIRRAIDSGALRAGRVRGEPGSRGGYRIRPGDLDAWVFGDAVQ